MNYLESRSPRERIMLYVMAGLIAVFVLWQFIVTPVMNARADGLRAQESALRDYVIVRDGVGALGQSVHSSTGIKAPFDRSAIVETARSVSMTISRIQPETDGDIKVWFEDVPSTSVYALLTQITQRYAAQVSRAQINRNDDGSVSAQITLRSTAL